MQGGGGGGGGGGAASKHDYLLKVLTIGDSTVGKSSLLLRYSTNRFASNYIATIGLDFKTKDLVLDGSRVRLQVRLGARTGCLRAGASSFPRPTLPAPPPHAPPNPPRSPRAPTSQLWDTAGQERFRTIAVAYFRGANAIMLVFDLTMRTSFAAVESWVKDIDKNADKRVAKILVGNKADLAEMPGEGLGGTKRAITVAEATACAKAHGMTYIETSAKSGANVDAAFERLAGLALDNVKREKQDEEERRSGAGGASQGKTVSLGKEPPTSAPKKSWC